jgi:hypothetical protein
MSSKSSRLNIENIGEKANYNNVLMIILIVIIIFFLVTLFFSEKVRVYRTVKNLEIYTKYQNVQSMTPAVLKNYKLCDFYVSSSYNSASSGYQMFDYVSADVVKKILQTGARYLEFQVYGDRFGEQADPIVSMGFKTGEWKLSLNTVYFEDVIKTIRDNAFRVYDGTDGSPNNKDPLFISLNLNTNYNYFVNNKIQKIFSKYLISYLLDATYNYQAKNIALTPLKELMGKVVIFCSDGFQGSNLEEIVNYSWKYPFMRKILNDDVEKEILEQPTNSYLTAIPSPTKSPSKTFEDNVKASKSSIETSETKKFNLTGVTIVSPHKEGDFITRNYDPTNAWSLGCQFVGMNFQKMDKNMDIYINKFKKYGFVLKPKKLRNA